MPVVISLLRGVNVGGHNLIRMEALRAVYESLGLQDSQTYVQSGNVVLSSDDPPEELERRSERMIAKRFGFDVPVIARTRDELAAVVERNPLADVARNPKRYQVSFLGGELDDSLVEQLAALAGRGERLVADGRELYAWHPDGVARSKLWAKLAGAGLGVKATARNWTTVTALLAMADG